MVKLLSRALITRVNLFQLFLLLDVGHDYIYSARPTLRLVCAYAKKSEKKVSLDLDTPGQIWRLFLIEERHNSDSMFHW